MIADARAFFPDDEIYPQDAAAALRHDLAALRTEFECVIDRIDGRYTLTSLGRLALLDLPDEDLEALAFLVSNFSASSLPNANRVDALLDRILSLLPDERRRGLSRSGRDVYLDYPNPSRSVNQPTLDRIRRALKFQELSFAYRSAYVPDEETVVLHRVAPYGLIFRDGHHYLDAYCYDCGDATIPARYRLYRLDRIVDDSVRILHSTLPPVPPPRPVFRLRYTLDTVVARQRDVALWFPRSSVTFHADGSADVSAETHDLWQARQILVRYREHCIVHDPPELVTMMREASSAMAARYAHGDGTGS
ncbi:MAG: WYL domain-containing protein [Chloroflexia bacterium]|nr:WYL domain-containing protein [Chloroflexia bacterium]